MNPDQEKPLRLGVLAREPLPLRFFRRMPIDSGKNPADPEQHEEFFAQRRKDAKKNRKKDNILPRNVGCE